MLKGSEMKTGIFLNTRSVLLVSLWKVKAQKNQQSKPEFFSTCSDGAAFEM